MPPRSPAARPHPPRGSPLRAGFAPARRHGAPAGGRRPGALRPIPKTVCRPQATLAAPPAKPPAPPRRRGPSPRRRPACRSSRSRSAGRRAPRPPRPLGAIRRASSSSARRAAAGRWRWPPRCRWFAPARQCRRGARGVVLPCSDRRCPGRSPRVGPRLRRALRTSRPCRARRDANAPPPGSSDVRRAPASAPPPGVRCRPWRRPPRTPR